MEVEIELNNAHMKQDLSQLCYWELLRYKWRVKSDGCIRKQRDNENCHDRTKSY